MSQGDSNPNQIKDRNWYNSIHESRMQALHGIRNAAIVSHIGQPQDETAHLKQAHSSTVSFFLELEPSIRNTQWADKYLKEADLGVIRFEKLEKVVPVQGFNTYVQLDNPVELTDLEEKTGLLGTRTQPMSESKLIPLTVIIQAYRLLRMFAHDHNLTKSEQEENIHGEPF